MKLLIDGTNLALDFAQGLNKGCDLVPILPNSVPFSRLIRVLTTAGADKSHAHQP